ncbi:replication region DNA-binding N-term [Andreprevotia lacus DSM 23236]|uniref:Replication region DNA-binding N-term n=1 Tax=Andreprevotia lacus DSM 23236 TaxID=1121001 RepID=A0A1W1XZT8_9NEIS|nr:DNA-binding protein [Andreprevotia lacus]SMC29387.1 replication region DNA-binding N-term [Andreprevotia lacus DSM 23236]
MARSGVYKSEVQRARDALIAQGKHPSIDAVRVELGNTGSKTTISRYLKELEEEEGNASDGKRVATSDAVQDLVGRLAARLHEEAEERVIALTTQHQGQLAEQHAVATELHGQVAALESQLQSLQAVLATEQATHAVTWDQLQACQLENTRLGQHAHDLKERLNENQRHVASLEEKHQHAREALEHYRTAIKQQREDEQRRHDQQLQQLQLENRQLRDTLIGKGDEIIQLNREAARLASEQQQLRTQQHKDEAARAQQVTELDALRAMARDHEVLRSKLQRSEQDVANLQGICEQQREAIMGWEGRLHEKELLLAEVLGRLLDRSNA